MMKVSAASDFDFIDLYINAHHGKLKYAIKILTSIGLKGGQNSYIDVKNFRDKLINDNNSSNDVKKSQKS